MRATDLTAMVAATRLLVPGRPVVVLLSGGRDSVCLLDVAVRIAGASAVAALHVNYGLRPAAEDDESSCRALCERLGVALELRRPRRAEGGGNVQAWAREARYAAAAEIAGGGDIAAGHTATDQAETILYRLASSPSRRALLGMRPRDGALVRPLLGITRGRTTAHCRACGLPWREDASNAGGSYARGRVRHGLVPALEAVHPAAQANVVALAEILRAEGEILDVLVEDVLGGATEIPVVRLRELSPPLRRLVVQRLADDVAGGLAPGVARRADEVAALPEQGRAALDLPGVRAVAERGIVRFVRRPAQRLQEGRRVSPTAPADGVGRPPHID